MREIKFRGKRLDGRWIYGDLWHRPYAKDCVTIVSFMEDTGTTGGLEVIPETVGQYTGLKDKNGKEIYEGDIITTDLERPYLVVEYRNGAFMLNCNDGLEDYYDIFFATSEDPKEVYKYGEVIGNIYENPELIT